MNGAELLTRLRDSREVIHEIDEDITRLTMWITSRKSIAEKTGIPTPDYDKMDVFIEKLEEAEARRHFAVKEVQRLNNEAVAFIRKVPAQFRSLLWYRYVDDMPFKEIAQELGISESRVYDLHRDALKTIEEDTAK